MNSAKVSIEREELNGVHEFVLRVDGERAGFLEFTRPDAGVMRIEYVEVDPQLRGTGVARQLVEKAVAFAQEAKLRVIPICSYARAVMQARRLAGQQRLQACKPRASAGLLAR